MRQAGEDHTELFHYTGATGLAGILSSGTLWATHFESLNDRQEYTLFFETRLPVLLTAAIDKAYDRVATHPHIAYEVRKSGGAVAYKRELHQVLLPIIRKFTSELNIPYVACFCTAETALITDHGLLSQWRGYGSDGGYALVFNAKKVDQLLAQEGLQVRGMDFFRGDVEYYDNPAEDVGLLPETSEQSDEVVNATADFLVGSSPDDASRIFTPVHRMAICTKHWGFREEREVRVVISQPHESVVRALPGEHVLKPVLHFMRGDSRVQYMCLFDLAGTSPKGRLPLERVIVGPHTDTSTQKAQVESLLQKNGYDIPVVISDIPFRG